LQNPAALFGDFGDGAIRQVGDACFSSGTIVIGLRISFCMELDRYQNIKIRQIRMKKFVFFA
jgi:hypothetical protein